MRLIDADALKEKAFFHEIDNVSYVEEEDIDKAPTIDAVERKRGEWIKNEGRRGWHCSCCKVDNYYAYSWNSESGRNEFQDNFCPNCGADMRKGEEE